MHVMQDQTRRLQDPLSEPDTDELTPNKDIHFGYHHSASGKHIQITNNGQGAERMEEYKYFSTVAYGAQPLKGLAGFEVKMMTYVAKLTGSLRLGLMRCKKNLLMESGSGIPEDSDERMWAGQTLFSGLDTPREISKYGHVDLDLREGDCVGLHLSQDGVKKNLLMESGSGISEDSDECMWAGQTLFNGLVTPREISKYGHVDLDDLREGDCVGLHLSQDGVLEFTVNGESQGIAAKNIYTRDTDVYAVVDHHGCCVATVITKAGECSYTYSTRLIDVHVQQITWLKYSLLFSFYWTTTLAH